jgi:hypothetical protein
MFACEVGRAGKKLLAGLVATYEQPMFLTSDQVE